MSNCLFCKIVGGQIPSKTVYKNDLVTAFRDLHPQAPTHVLIVPNQHIAGAGALEASHAPVLAAMFAAARRVTEAEGLSSRGYRLVINEGPDAGQSVFHLHLHVLGGRAFAWPAG